MVGYQNVGRGSGSTHVLLERCAEKGVDIIFVGECWKSLDNKATTTHGQYVLGSEVREGSQVMVYWLKK